MTAHQLGKIIVQDKGDVGASYWSEDTCIEWDTVAEYNAIQDACDKQLRRVARFLRCIDWRELSEHKRDEDRPPRRPLPWGGEAG